MDREQYERVSRLFEQALDLDPAARADFLRRLAEESPTDAAELEAMLSADVDRPEYLETAGIAARLSGPAMTAPETIGPYRILERVGIGGMGEVFRAEQQHPKREVAIKMIRPNLALPFTDIANQLERRFSLEAEILGRLQHRGIAQIYEAGTTETALGPTPYLAMEFVRGEPLDGFVRSHDSTVPERLELIIEIAQAVHHAHVRGIVHRDLKPGNILVEDTGQPKVLDFGIARVIDDEALRATIATEEGQWLGTISYMSPEQIEGRSADIDTRSDVYSLTVITYELLAGSLPYDLDGLTIPRAVQTIMTTEPIPLGRRRSSLRGDLDTIIAKGLERDKERRYASADEFARDLRRFLDDEPIQAKPATTFYRIRKFARRNKGLVTGVSLALVAIVVGAISSVIFALSAREQAERANENFAQVYDISREFLFEFEAMIRELPGSTQARNLILRKALELLDGLEASASDDPGLASDLGWAYVRVGNLQARSLLGDEGDATAARESYEKGRAILARLLRDTDTDSTHPDDLELRHRYAAALSALSEAWLEVGHDVDEAARLHRESLDLLERLHQRAPRDDDITKTLAEQHDRMGRRAVAQSNPNDALEHFERSLELCRLIAGHSGDPQARANVATALDRIGNFRRLRGEDPLALRAYEEALALRRAVHEAEPNQRSFLSGISVSLAKLGDRYRARSEIDRARAYYQESLDIRRRLVAADPFSYDAQSQLATILERLGKIAEESNDFETALAHFTESKQICRSIAQQAPQSLDARRNLALALTRVGDTEARLGHADASTTLYRESHEIRRAIAEQWPEQITARRELAISYSRIAKISLRAQDEEKALEELRRSQSLLHEAWQAEPDNLEYGRTYTVLADQVGHLLLRLDRLPEATEVLQQSLAAKTTLIERAPDNVALQRTRLTSHYLLADLHHRQSQTSRQSDPNRTATHLDQAIDQIDRCIAGFESLQSRRQLSPRDAAELPELREVANRYREERRALE